MTINGSTNSSQWTFKIETYESSWDINSNTSQVVVEVYLGRASSRSYCGGKFSGNINVNGENRSYSGTIPYPTYINGGAWYRVANTTFTVGHDSDGKKTTGVSASWSANFTPTSANASGNLTLTTIPRASSISCTSAYIEEVAQITVNRKSNNFSHVIAYSLNGSAGSESHYIYEDGTTGSDRRKITNTSIGFTLPSRWYQYIPNDSSITVTIAIDTYSGDTQIGSTQRSTFVARVNENKNKPTISTVVEDINEETLSITEDSNTLIKNKSTAKVTSSIQVKNYSTIKNIKVNGVEFTGNVYEFPFTTEDINVTVTDSRGFSSTSKPTFTLINYFEPNLTIKCYRVEPTSSYAKILFNGNWFNGKFKETLNNDISIKWFYKQIYHSDWIDGGVLENNVDYKIVNNNIFSGVDNEASEIQIGGNLTYNYGWDIKLEIKDKISTIEPTVSISKGIPIFWWNNEDVYINGNLHINGDVGVANVLFDKWDGEVGNITLNDEIENYKYFEFYYGRSTWGDPWECSRGMVRPTDRYNYCALSSTYGFGSNGLIFITAFATLKGTSVTFDNNRSIVKEIVDGNINYYSNENQIRVFRVIGYK